MASLQLYHHGMSVCAAKVRMVLAEKEMDWESLYIDIRAGESLQPEYLKLNPKGVVPTLVHDGNVIRESTVICEYIEEISPEPSLVPANPQGRAKMRNWTKQIDEGLHFPAVAALTFAIVQRQGFRTAVERFGFGMAVPEDSATGINDRQLQNFLEPTGLTIQMIVNALRMYDRHLEAMELALESSTWLSGEIFSLADIGITPYIQRLDSLQLDWLWEQRPNVTDWYERTRSRPSYGPSITSWFNEKEIDLMTTNGTVIRNSLRSLYETTV